MIRRSSAKPTTPDASLILGTWEIQRRILDHRAGTTASFSGRATITSTRFEETGQLTFGPSVLHATRAYQLQFGKRSVTVTHPDGSEFIVLHAQPSQTVRHHCGADLYVGRFFFVDADTWAEAWRVVGPRKRYVSLARYRRLPG